jgi:hypothetical protein
MRRGIFASISQNLMRHCPRMRAIQVTTADPTGTFGRQTHRHGVLDRPLSRAMTL